MSEVSSGYQMYLAMYKIQLGVTFYKTLGNGIFSPEQVD